MSQPFSVTRRVEFCETDAAGIAHFSAFLCYMEQAEHALLRHLGTSVSTDIGDGWHLSWPRVHVSCDYRGSARFEDCLNIQVRVVRLGTRSVTYGFQFALDLKSVVGQIPLSQAPLSQAPEAQSLVEGKVVAVCCKVRTGSPLESIEIPSELRAKLEQYM